MEGGVYCSVEKKARLGNELRGEMGMAAGERWAGAGVKGAC